MAQDINDIIKQSREVYSSDTVDLKQYIRRAIETESVVGAVVTDPDFLKSALLDFLAAAERLDVVKKRVFYGKALDSFPNIHGYLVPEKELYEVNARLFHAIIGIMTEAAELGQLLHDITFKNKRVPDDKFADELGDLNWYEAIAIDTLGLSFAGILRANNAKLKVRHPDGFANENITNRNTENERIAVRNNLDDDTSNQNT